MIYTIKKAPRVYLLFVDVLRKEKLVERIIPAGNANAPATPTDVNVILLDVEPFQDMASFRDFAKLISTKLKTSYNDDNLDIYFQYAKKEQQFSKKERYLYSRRLQLYRLSRIKALSLPLQTKTIKQPTPEQYHTVTG